MPAIEVRGLLVERGGQPVLHGLDLTVPAGQITGLLGPSGCGKSTLMRSIVGVQIVAEGDVRVLGEPAGSPQIRERVGYVTQAPAVYSDLTVRENLSYFGRVLGAPPDAIEQTIETVALGAFADRQVHTMSGGQRSRASLATALLGRPELIVLDEPTVGLDPVLREELWGTFHRWPRCWRRRPTRCRSPTPSTASIDWPRTARWAAGAGFDVAMVVAMTILALVLGALTLRRRTP